MKGYLELSFAWLFALIVGAVILFLAIFFAVKLIGTEETAQDAATAKSIEVLLNPLETSFETGKKTLLETAVDTRIYSECEENDDFGIQKLRTSQKSLNKWTDSGIRVSSQNRYIFAEKEIEGKEFYILSFPFEFPFKTADLIVMIPKNKNYCFVNPSEEFFKTLYDLNLQNVKNVSNAQNCPSGSQVFCFGSNCGSQSVDEGSKKVRKNGTMEYETQALMYSAVFSEPQIYNCQLKRLMARVESLASLYEEKSSLVAQKNCNSNLNFQGLISDAEIVKENPSFIHTMKRNVEEIEEANDRGCALW